MQSCHDDTQTPAEQCTAQSRQWVVSVTQSHRWPRCPATHTHTVQLHTPQLYYALQRIFIKYAIANHIPWKQISYRIRWCNFHSNQSTFEKVIAKIQRGPDFMKHGVYTHTHTHCPTTHTHTRVKSQTQNMRHCLTHIHTGLTASWKVNPILQCFDTDIDTDDWAYLVCRRPALIMPKGCFCGGLVQRG